MPRAADPETRKLVLRHYARGVPVQALADTYGIKKSVVYKWAHVVGIRRTNNVRNSAFAMAAAGRHVARCENVAAPTGPAPTLYCCPVCDGISEGAPWHPGCAA